MTAIAGLAHVELSVSDLETSVQWYCRLLEAQDVFRAANTEVGISACAIFEPHSRTVLAFTQHDRVEERHFSPRRVGLDHLAFRVAERADLDRWQTRLEQLGIAHDGIRDDGYAQALTFRDPDGIALEFWFSQPAERSAGTG